MTRGERKAWRAFEQYMRDAQPAMDGCVPVALICLPVEREHADGSLSLRRPPEASVRVIWPADFPVEDRGWLLKMTAAPYEEGTVTR